MMYLSSKDYKRLNFSTFIFEVKFPIFEPKVFIVQYGIVQGVLSIAEAAETAWW